MSVLVKLNEARKEFHASKIEKTGWNSYSEYKYFELADFLIPALAIFERLKLSAVVSFGVEVATMTLTDLEDNSQFVIQSPMSTAKLKACHEVQNLGAVQTYIRRYLWVAALEIVEHDAIDSGPGPADEKAKSRIKSVSQETFDAMSPDEQQFLRDFAMDVYALLDKGDPLGAYNLIANSKLDADEKVAINALFDSKQRRAMKDAKAAADEKEAVPA